LQEQDLEREDGRPTDGAPLGLTSLIGPTEGDAQRSQAAYLSNANLPATHRRRVASQIGRIAGNRHVQRVVAASRSREPKIQRVWDPPELQANGIQFLQEVGRISSVYNDYELRARSDENSEDLTSYGREML
jgi:hypothetical protein